MIKRNYSKPFACLKMTILSLFLAGILAGCGIRGQLKTPPPLFGGDAKVDQSRIPKEDLDKREDEEDEFIDLDVERSDSLSDF